MEIILTRKKLIIIGFLSVFSVTLIGVFLMPPVYRATTKIYIDSPALPRMAMPYLKEMGGRSFLGNQKEIIGSRFILERAVKELGMHEPKGPASLKARIISRYNNILGRPISTADPLEGAIGFLRKSVDTRLPRGTNIVTIGAQSQSAKHAALIANTLASTYIEFANQQLINQAQNAFGFMEAQASEVLQKMTVAQQALSDFKKRQLTISIVEESSIITRRLNNAEEEYQQIGLKLASLERQKDTPFQATTNSDVIPEIQALNEDLNDLQSQLADASAYLTPQHPDIKILVNKIARLEKKIKAASQTPQKPPPTSPTQRNLWLRGLTTEIETLTDKKNYLATLRDALVQKQEELAGKQFTLDKLQRELGSHRETYAGLKAKMDNAQILKATEMTEGSIRVIDKAFAPASALMKKKLILLAVGTMIAIIFSLGMAFIADSLDDSLKTPEEAEKYLDLPVLGAVPTITKQIRKAS
jgi:uncharacterized protein involved in exopolysaccharide biosynthesis